MGKRNRPDLVRMTGEGPNHLTGRKITEDEGVLLVARDRDLAVAGQHITAVQGKRDGTAPPGEIGESLSFATCHEIPELDVSGLARGKSEPAVRRKGHRRYAFCVPDEGPELLARCEIPELKSLIKAP